MHATPPEGNFRNRVRSGRSWQHGRCGLSVAACFGTPEYGNPHALQKNRHADAKSVHFPESSGKLGPDYFFSATGSMRTGLWMSNRLLRSK